MKGMQGNQTAGQEARGDDFYPTPYAAFPPLLVAERRKLPKVIWESACGNGALAIPLRNRGFTVVASDLNDWGCPQAEAGVDFLGESAATTGASLTKIYGDRWGIVTNPPFNIIEEFIERATAMAPYVAILCRLSFLESEGRMGWFQRMGLRRIHVIAERLPMIHRHGYTGKKISNSGICFAWMIYERRPKVAHSVPLRWVSWKKACRLHPEQDADAPPAPKEQLGLFA